VRRETDAEARFLTTDEERARGVTAANERLFGDG
jgi:hypothetical protein